MDVYKMMVAREQLVEMGYPLNVADDLVGLFAHGVHDLRIPDKAYRLLVDTKDDYEADFKELYYNEYDAAGAEV